MKIIKKGSKANSEKKPETFKKECGYCESVFTYDSTETQRDRHGKYVICPVCGKFLAID